MRRTCSGWGSRRRARERQAVIDGEDHVVGDPGAAQLAGPNCAAPAWQSLAMSAGELIVTIGVAGECVEH